MNHDQSSDAKPRETWAYPSEGGGPSHDDSRVATGSSTLMSRYTANRLLDAVRYAGAPVSTALILQALCATGDLVSGHTVAAGHRQLLEAA